MQKRPVQNVLLPIFRLLHFSSDEKSAEFANESAAKRNQKVFIVFSSSVLPSDAGGGITIIQLFLVIITITFCIRTDMKIIVVISFPDIRSENEGLVKAFT